MIVGAGVGGGAGERQHAAAGFRQVGAGDDGADPARCC